jgi:PAS domain S-box-containing protein
MILGYGADELIDRMGPDDLVHPDDRERVAESTRARLAGEMEAIQYRFRIIRKNGEIIDCEVLGRRVDYQGRPAIMGTLMDITDRKRAEDALRESEARYRTVIAAIAEGVITHDAEGNVIAANSSAKQILGLTTEQMLEGALADVHWTVIREDGSPFPMADRPVRKTLATGQSQSGIVMGLQRPEGNTTWLMNNSEPLYSENQNELVGVVTTFRDITERKRAEDVLRESEERYRSVIAAIGEGVIIHDTDGNAIATNHSAEQLLRLTAEQIIEDGALRDAYWTVVREDGSPYPLEERPVMKTLATGESQSNVIMGLQRPDGNTIWLMNNSEPLHAQNRDELAGVVASFWDITERKHEQQALQESEELHRSLFENAPIGLAIIRDDGDLMACNDALLHPGGYTREDVAGINIMSLFHNLEEAIEIVEIFDREGKIEEFETQLRRKDDTPYDVLLSMRPVQMGGQPGWQVLVDDITERKTSEAMLKDLNQRLRDRAAELTRSNAELESFAYVASHDLQEPLRMVSSYVELLARRYQGQLDDDADEFIAYAVDGANRMRNLINDLLLYSRAGTRGKDFEVVDGEEVLSASLANLRLAIEESGATISHDPLPTILADARQLGQVFQNLISNAIKFRSEKPPEIHISAEQTGDKWRFSVRDNGLGVAPEFFDRIFVIFQRLHTKEEYPGTGIGLAVSKRIVERHGGQMWLESQPEEGTTFYFTLSGDGDHHLENGGDITD